MIFDEASSWWSPQEVVLPYSKEIEEKLQERVEQDEVVEEGEEITQEEGLESSEKSKFPWRTGVHQQTSEEACPSQLEEI